MSSNMRQGGGPTNLSNPDGGLAETASSNAAVHRIAITQTRLDGLGKAYYEKRLNAGDSKPEALRCLKRRLSRIVYRCLQTDHTARAGTCIQAAA
ncbi:hypothetical protein [Sinomonas sp. ASV322]|uniref:hypothetical protein n=1 Tax=Sinomonas sp. ASV322 TaxID=3041920 RepID=UPI0027DC2601|nr:hypothetical protein [Sinomonas sp. ASV322]MDQ4504407.1 hypothetical protein [Sinomonas sp. ASV322]